jgi:hypothetical protein
MTSAIDGPVISCADSAPLSRREPALSAARRFLAETAETITPDTPAGELLACLTRYRAHLSALAADPVLSLPKAKRLTVWTRRKDHG